MEIKKGKGQTQIRTDIQNKSKEDPEQLRPWGEDEAIGKEKKDPLLNCK